MSEYKRNPAMVICIFAVIALGALTVGLLTATGSNWGWFGHHNDTTTFEFESTATASDQVSLTINLHVGEVYVKFSDNPSLLYQVTMVVSNSTIATNGEPTVTFASNTISIDYPVANVNVTLGTGTNYSISIQSDTGDAGVTLANNAHVGNLSISLGTGSVSLTMTDNVTINGKALFKLNTNFGDINAMIDLPSSVGGSFAGSAAYGTVTITPVGWTEVGSDQYQTDNYNTSTVTVSITATTGTGTVTAILT